ncbi:LOW QUALITY PROTEIN: hypothetical protein HZS_4921 [Henneguya salminicola]|nr:LOW QUALITY PROTEIN: hypothetical protein HZS_4921 [Henneguya salminicola]
MNSIESVMSPPLSLERNAQPFFRRYWAGETYEEEHRILIRAANESLILLRYNSHTFIDGRFKITPHLFFQSDIVMAYDCGTELYVPCAFALLRGKKKYTLLQQLITLMEYIWMPKTIATDFEKALFSAAKQEFTESRILGCYFHLKAALQRK